MLRAGAGHVGLGGVTGRPGERRSATGGDHAVHPYVATKLAYQCSSAGIRSSPTRFDEEQDHGHLNLL
ncbi:hypothetical protein FHX81_2026 [Saccharothrix saharensis]|uniref:Uncharacterized protein n=1 Tax=Saccharothrix saharensis TaxID=571190 RepID=A0A543JA76_9PSEU|nr:hypothetical protein FHX81_2026 [Saccharothrix saharensis]